MVSLETLAVVCKSRRYPAITVFAFALFAFPYLAQAVTPAACANAKNDFTLRNLTVCGKCSGPGCPGGGGGGGTTGLPGKFIDCSSSTYGAIDDGVTDNCITAQKCLDACTAQGGTALFPMKTGGVYGTTCTLHGHSNCEVAGGAQAGNFASASYPMGPWDCTAPGVPYTCCTGPHTGSALCGSNGSVLKWLGGGNQAVIDFIGVKYAKLWDMGINCNNAAGSAGVWYNTTQPTNNPISTHNNFQYVETFQCHHGFRWGDSVLDKTPMCTSLDTPWTGCQAANQVKAGWGALEVVPDCIAAGNPDPCCVGPGKGNYCGKGQSDSSEINHFQAVGIVGDNTAAGIFLNTSNGDASLINGGEVNNVHYGVENESWGGYSTISRVYVGSATYGANAVAFYNGPEAGPCRFLQNETEQALSWPYSFVLQNVFSQPFQLEDNAFEAGQVLIGGKSDCTGVIGDPWPCCNSTTPGQGACGQYVKVTSINNQATDPQPAWTIDSSFAWVESFGERIRWNPLHYLHFLQSSWGERAAGGTMLVKRIPNSGTAIVSPTCTTLPCATTYYYKIARMDQSQHTTAAGPEGTGLNSAALNATNFNIITDGTRGITLDEAPFHAFYGRTGPNTEQLLGVCPGNIHCVANNQFKDDGTVVPAGAVPTVNETDPLALYDGTSQEIDLYPPSTGTFASWVGTLPATAGHTGQLLQSAGGGAGNPMTWGPQVNTIANLPACTADNKGTLAVASNCNVPCTMNAMCVASGAYECLMWCSTSGWREVGPQGNPTPAPTATATHTPVPTPTATP